MKYQDAPLQCRWFKSRKCCQNRKTVLKSECTPCILAQDRCRQNKWYKDKKAPIEPSSEKIKK